MPASNILTIYGVCEEVVSEEMIKEGKLTKIQLKDLPPSHLVNEYGVMAKFAVIVPSRHVAEFEKRIMNLRA